MTVANFFLLIKIICATPMTSLRAAPGLQPPYSPHTSKLGETSRKNYVFIAEEFYLSAPVFNALHKYSI